MTTQRCLLPRLISLTAYDRLQDGAANAGQAGGDIPAPDGGVGAPCAADAVVDAIANAGPSAGAGAGGEP